MRSLRIAIVAVLLSVTTPALADKYFAVTPSGAAETVWAQSASEVVGMLSSKGIDRSWKIISSTATELVCEAPMNFGQSLLGQMLMGNSYSTPPRRFFRFNVADVEGVSRGQASGWMELQMAFGQVKRTDFSGPEFQNGIMDFMVAAGGKLPFGTTFPNHVMMGFKADNVMDGKNLTFRVTEVDPGGPADAGGMKVGDVVDAVAGKHFKNSGQYLDATAEATKASIYDVEVERGGKKMTLKLARAFRPPWPERVAPRTAPALPTSSPTVVMPASTADEIAKLAKLRDQGILTPAEFESQKKKLLGP